MATGDIRWGPQASRASARAPARARANGVEVRRWRMQVEPPAGLDDLARDVVPDQGRQAPRDVDQQVEVDTGVVTHQRQRMHDLLAADVAGGARCIRAAPDAAERRIEAVGAGGYAGQHIGQPHAAGVVEVQRQFGIRPAPAKGRGQRGDLARIGHAGRVAKSHATGAEFIDEALAPSEHRCHRDVALHRAPETARQGNVDRDASVKRKGVDLRQRGLGLGTGHAQVGQVVHFAGRHDQVHLVGPGIDGTFGTAHIRHQRAVDDARHTCDFAQDDLTVGECRNGLGRSERGDLDLGQTSA